MTKHMVPCLFYNVEKVHIFNLNLNNMECCMSLKPYFKGLF